MMNLNDKIAIITGAASGIGKAIAQAFAREGVSVVIADKDAEKGERLAVALINSGQNAMFCQTDVRESADCKNTVDAAVKRFGGLHILVNNAGLQHVAPISEFPEDKWDELTGVMLKGSFLLTKYSFPHMVKNKWGRVVNIASIYAMVGVKYKAAYVSSKHGMIGLTKVTALEGAEHNITANAVCPAYVRTPLLEGQIADQAAAHGISEDEVMEKVILSGTPIKRLIEPEEIASLVLMLASDRGASITGAVIPIDLGYTSI